MSDSAGGPPQVLVVEDDAEILRLVQRVLEEEGCHVTATSGLDAALALLPQQRYQLVVTDLFPGQGQEALESIEALLAEAAPIPVGVMTGWQVEKEAAQAVGVAFVVRKPFDLEELVEAVEQALNPKGTQESPQDA